MLKVCARRIWALLARLGLRLSQELGVRIYKSLQFKIAQLFGAFTIKKHMQKHIDIEVIS